MANITTVNIPRVDSVLKYNANSNRYHHRRGPATHFSIAAVPSNSVTAGTPFTIVATALDQFGATRAVLHRVVHFTIGQQWPGTFGLPTTLSRPPMLAFIPLPSSVKLITGRSMV